MKQPIALQLDNSSGYKCANCDGIFFTEAFLVRRWSKILTGTPEDYVQPIPCFRCVDCGTPLTEIFPKGMKDVEAVLGIKEVVEPSSSNLLLS